MLCSACFGEVRGTKHVRCRFTIRLRYDLRTLIVRVFVSNHSRSKDFKNHAQAA